MTHPAVLIAFGIFIGVFSGIMGLGGGALMIPVMVLVLGLPQVKAHGLSLAVMIPPVTLPAVIAYLRDGKLEKGDLWMALFIAIGFACGSFFGASIATRLPKDTLKLVFGFVLVYVAGYTIFSWFGKEYLLRTVILAALLLIVTGAFFMATKWYNARTAEKSSVQMN